MVKTLHIASLDSPGLTPYKTLRRPTEHLQERIFVAEGEKVVRRLLISNLFVRSLLVTPQWYERLKDEEGVRMRADMVIYVADQELLHSIVGFKLHQGIMGIANIPSTLSLEELVRGNIPPQILVALDGLVSAENVGTIVRNCAAFGAQGVLVGETSSSPYLRRAVRNSMGTVFNLPIVQTTNLSEDLQLLIRDFSFAVIGAHPHEGKTIADGDFGRNVVLVLGNEGDGISQNILAACTDRIAIPMMNMTDSLNVASASAVFLYEIQRQRAAPALHREVRSSTLSR